jgi:hypothetical protein
MIKLQTESSTVIEAPKCKLTTTCLRLLHTIL